jgi:hypothetical protein
MHSPFVTYIKAHIKTRTEYRGKQSDPPHLNHSKLVDRARPMWDPTCWLNAYTWRGFNFLRQAHAQEMPQWIWSHLWTGSVTYSHWTDAIFFLIQSWSCRPGCSGRCMLQLDTIGSSTLRPLIHPIYHTVHMPVPCSNCLFKACHNVQESKRHPCVKLGGHLDVEEKVRVYTRIHKYIVRIHIWLYNIILCTVCICIMMYTYVPLQSLPLHVYIFCCIYAHICSYVLHLNQRCPISSRLPSWFQALVQSQREACRARISGSDGDDDHYC